MGYDQLSPIAPARVRCLLLPCGRIRLDRFTSFAKRIEQETVVRLSDVKPEPGAKRGMFSPSAFPSGSILYDLSSSDVAPSSRHMAPFELYRQPLIILGIADGLELETSRPENGQTPPERGPTQSQDKEAYSTVEESFEELSAKIETFREQHPSALIHRVFVFESSIASTPPDSVFSIPPVAEATSTALKTAICDMTAQFMDELSSFAKSVQALPNIETPAPRSLSTPDGQSPRSGPQSDLTRSAPNRPGSASPPIRSAPAGDRSPQRTSLPLQVSSPLASEFKPDRERSMSPTDRSRPPITFDEINQDRPTSAPAVEKTGAANKVSVHGFGSGTTGERARNQARGRLGVVLGSMYLLAGRWRDAIKELVDSATIAKWSNDHPWYAKALDYILVGLLMCGWAGIEFEIPQICYPTEKPPWTFAKPLKMGASDTDAAGISTPTKQSIALRNLCQLLPDLVNNILYFYTRSATSSYSDKIPMLSFSESAIRFSRLLAIVKMSRGVLDEQCLQDTVLNAVSKRSLTEIPEHTDSFTNSAEIAALAFRAMPMYDTEDSIDVVDRLNVLAGIASVLALLEFHRKKAFVLRELLIGLLPALVQSRKDNAAELGFHPAASLSISDLMLGSAEGHGVSGLSNADSAGIGTFLDILCEVYGVVKSNLDSSKLQNDFVEQDMAAVGSSRIALQLTQRGFGNSNLKMDILRWCINICEALPDLPGMLRFSSYLLATASSGMAPGPESNDAYPTIPTEDQTRLIDTLLRASDAIKQLSLDGPEANYWDEFLIREVEVLAPTTSDLPIKRAKHELQLAGESAKKSGNGPFIYNPFTAKTTSATIEPTLLLNEKATFMVLVQNLFDVNLEIEWLRLDAKDGLLEVSARNLMIGPYRTQKVYLTGVAKAAGQLHINGCVAKVRGCEPRTFLIFESQWKPPEDVKVKVSGLAASLQPKTRPLSTSSDPSQMASLHASRLPAPARLKVNVIKNQPVIHAKPLTLSQATVMVLLGQRKIVSITLVNNTQEVIDFLAISFVDSTSSILQQAVENKEMPPSDLYEIEHSTYRQPAFRLVGRDNVEDLSIPAHSEVALEIEVLGKPGLVHGAMQVSYAHLGVPKADIGDNFWTRQLMVPLAVTVNASVELIRTEVLPIPADFAGHVLQSQVSWDPPQQVAENRKLSDNAGLQTPKKPVKNESREQERYLLLLDFHNSWPQPLSVAIQFSEAESEERSTTGISYTTKKVIQPGRSTRFTLPMPKTLGGDPHAPIPALNPANKRQFVLSASKTSIEIERIGREMFWYREGILKHLRATWHEEDLDRSGQINLRTMRLSPRMVDTLKPEAVCIDVSVQPPSVSDKAVEEMKPTRYSCAVDSFAKITIKITNRGLYPIRPLLRLQPSLRNQPYNVALDLSRKLAFNGLLQRPLPLLRAREFTEFSLGVVFLCAGEYEIGACVEELVPRKEHSSSEGNRARAATGEFAPTDFEASEREIWYASSPCLIDVSSSRHPVQIR